MIKIYLAGPIFKTSTAEMNDWRQYVLSIT